MKQFINICLLLVLGMSVSKAQHHSKEGKGKGVNPDTENETGKDMSGRSQADTLTQFEHFYKSTMTTFPGAFTVYQDQDRYFMQIDSAMLNRDILVIGDLKNGPAVLAKSSGIIKLTKGFNNNLNVIRNSYSEVASDNPAMKELLDKSTVPPVSFVLHIEAMGKEKGSFIIEITQQLNQGGDLFSFQNFFVASTPDPSRSGVMGVRPVDNGVVFTVTHSQTDYNKDTNSSKGEDRASTYELELIFQQLNNTLMPVTYSDRRVGFETESYTDFGRAKYSARKVNVIKKWNISMKPEDAGVYEQGVLVEPVKPILVYIDKNIPGLYLPYVQKGILQWNKCFEEAGFKNVLKITTSPDDAWISSGKILVKWGNAIEGVSTSVIDDPRTGEILAARMNVSEEMVDDVLPKYFVQCGRYDKRVQTDLYTPTLRGDIMEFKVAQAMSKLLGMLPNYAGSAAYTPQQLKDKSFLTSHGFTSSVTDDIEFNFLPQTDTAVDPSLLIAHVGSYDRFAINWAYRVQSKEKRNSLFLKNGAINPDYYYTAEDKKNPATQHVDLSSDNLEAATLGLKSIKDFYPGLEKITAVMKNEDDDWYNYILIAFNFIQQYSAYVNSVLPNIGGRYSTVVMRNYNDVPYRYVSKARQQQTFDFLNEYLLKGVPVWLSNKRAQSIDGSNTETIMLRNAQTVLDAFSNPDVISSLLKAEESEGKKAFTTADLFRNIDHYIFQDFNPNTPGTSYSRALQASMITHFIDMAAKNKISGGVSDIAAVMNTYMNSLISHVDQMCKLHKDPLTRENYKLMKVQLNNNYINKE